MPALHSVNEIKPIVEMNADITVQEKWLSFADSSFVLRSSPVQIICMQASLRWMAMTLPFGHDIRNFRHGIMTVGVELCRE